MKSTEPIKARIQRRQARKLRAHRMGWFFQQMHQAVEKPPPLEPVKVAGEKQEALKI